MSEGNGSIAEAVTRLDADQRDLRQLFLDELRALRRDLKSALEDVTQQLRQVEVAVRSERRLNDDRLETVMLRFDRIEAKLGDGNG